MAKRTNKKKTTIPKKASIVNEGNLYDKIFKENAEHIFLPLIEAHLGLKFTSFVPMQEKMQTTIEREMDFFYEVTAKNRPPFILHLEFQTEADEEMVYRFSEYHGMALRRKRKPIKHLVIYLGKGVFKMQNILKTEEVYTGFEVINIFELNRANLLTSQVPAYIVSAVLTNFEKEKVEAVLRLIVVRLKQVCKTKSELSRYLNQLIILARLRKFEDTATKIINDMPITYDIETDFLYKKGIQKGREKGIVEGETLGIDSQATVTIINFFLKTPFPIETVADITGVQPSFVMNLYTKLGKLELKTTWEKFKDIESNPSKKEERFLAIANDLVKLDTLSTKVISKVTELDEKEVIRLRKKLH